MNHPEPLLSVIGKFQGNVAIGLVDLQEETHPQDLISQLTLRIQNLKIKDITYLLCLKEPKEVSPAPKPTSILK